MADHLPQIPLGRRRAGRLSQLSAGPGRSTTSLSPCWPGRRPCRCREFEDPKYFEGCLPVEVMLARGPQTLRFGPMKPVGLMDPRTGKVPYAVVQLRAENLERTTYNMVGFQTKLTYPEQKRVFRAIPGLEQAEFARLGSIHRNTFVCAPEVLLPTLQMKVRPDLFLAGQLSGVEGYVESAAMGLLGRDQSSPVSFRAGTGGAAAGHRPRCPDPPSHRIRPAPFPAVQCHLWPLPAADREGEKERPRRAALRAGPGSPRLVDTIVKLACGSDAALLP